MRRRRALLWYFALAFGISWIGVALAGSPASIYLMFVAMLLGPSLASVGLTAAFGGAPGLRALARRLFRWRIGARWYAAVFVAPVLLSAVLAVLSLLSPSFVPAIVSGASPAGPVVAYALMGGLGAGIFEELGWTGFATPRLLRRHGWLAAGVLLGLPWALWHMLPDYLGHAAHGATWIVHALEWFVALAAFRAFMTWIYSHTKSLLLGVLLHASFTGSQALAWPSADASQTEVVWYGAFALGLWLVVAVVIVASRGFASVAASDQERLRTMPGDSIVPDPMSTVTHAITIDAPPERVWPWLAQMGSARAGWYSYDRIDNGGHPSATRVVDELQHVAPGDVMPALPGAKDIFVVAAVEPPRDIILTVPGDGGPVMSWEHLVDPLGVGRSRLLVRGRVGRSWKRMAREARTAGQKPVFIEYVYRVLGRLPDSWMIALGGAGHRWMEARHMRGVKRRAEAPAST